MTSEEMQARIEFLEASVNDLQETNAELEAQRDELRDAIAGMLHEVKGQLHMGRCSMSWRPDA